MNNVTESTKKHITFDQLRYEVRSEVPTNINPRFNPARARFSVDYRKSLDSHCAFNSMRNKPTAEPCNGRNFKFLMVSMNFKGTGFADLAEECSFLYHNAGGRNLTWEIARYAR